MSPKPRKPLSERRHNLDRTRGGTPIGFWRDRYVDAVKRVMRRAGEHRAVSWVQRNYRVGAGEPRDLYHNVWRFPAAQRGITKWLLVAMNSRLSTRSPLLPSERRRRRVNRSLLHYFYVMGVSGEELVERRAKKEFDRAAVAAEEAALDLQRPAHKRRRRKGTWKEPPKSSRAVTLERLERLQHGLGTVVNEWRETLRAKAFQRLVATIAEELYGTRLKGPLASLERHSALHYIENVLLKDVAAFRTEFKRDAAGLEQEKIRLERKMDAGEIEGREIERLHFVANAVNSLNGLLRGVDFFEKDVQAFAKALDAPKPKPGGSQPLRPSA